MSKVRCISAARLIQHFDVLYLSASAHFCSSLPVLCSPARELMRQTYGHHPLVDFGVMEEGHCRRITIFWSDTKTLARVYFFASSAKCGATSILEVILGSGAGLSLGVNPLSLRTLGKELRLLCWQLLCHLGLLTLPAQNPIFNLPCLETVLISWTIPI